MIMCSRCHKRPAVVFLSPTGDAKESRGLCLVCARELGIKPVNDLLDKMGITDEQMEAMESELNELVSENSDDADGADDGNPGETALSGFVPGGAATMPFLQNFFPDGGTNSSEHVQEPPQKAHKDKHKTKRKHLNAYCTDLTGKARSGQIDAVIGREKEISRIIQILSRRTKNNPADRRAGSRQNRRGRGACHTHSRRQRTRRA